MTSKKILLHHCFQRFTDSLYDYFLENETLEIDMVELLMIESFSNGFTQKEMSEMFNICQRTIRDKYKNGFKRISDDIKICRKES
jgi:predicted ferric reductase